MTGKLVAFGAGVALSFLALTGSALASFGFRSGPVGFEYSVVNQDLSPAAHAGSHPWAIRTSFNMNGTTNESGEEAPDGDVKDVEVDLPVGLVGNPGVTPKCTLQQFTTPRNKENLPPGSSYEISGATCAANSQVGVAELRLSEDVSESYRLGVYDLVAPPGIPAEFGFNFFGVPIVLTASVAPGGDYGLVVNLRDVSQALDIFGGAVTFWGVPAEASHDYERGECLGAVGGPVGPPGGCPTETISKPFLTLPTGCPAEPSAISIFVDSWQNPVQSLDTEGVSDEAVNHNSLGTPVGITGCNRLDFSPSLTIRPDTEAASTPTGLEANLTVPQSENPTGLAESHLRDAEVTLPAGLVVNPSAANGREACTPEQIDLNDTADPASCPDASKVGTVTAVTPLLENSLEGSIYLAQQEANPFGSLLAIYVVVEGDGVRVKLAGRVQANPATGQLTTIFDGNRKYGAGSPLEGEPQLPFSSLKLDFFGGPRAALMTPAACGTYSAAAALTPWSGAQAATPEIQPFKISTGCGGGFAPSFTAGTVNNEAGGFSPFVTSISRTDQDQRLGRIGVSPPPGLLGLLSKVTLCAAPQAAAGQCPAASQIGHVSASAGAGPDPVTLPQAGKQQDPVFLTGAYEGAPFGLAIVVHAEAGPFNLGQVVVRAQIDVDPHTGQLTVVSDPLPTILDGIPLDVRTVTVTVDGAGREFTFNPTDCEPLAATGTIASTQGASANMSSRFQAANCALLPFHPKFTVTTQGKTSKAGGASLDVKVLSGAGQANIHRVVVSLPKQLPSRLTTIQQACPEATFAANPAACPAGSDVGTARAVTPVLNVPLTGPAYLVSHGGAAFPDLVTVLEGEGIRLDLVGNINITKKGITSSTFAAVPDAPISSFELKLPEGPHSALTTDLHAKAKRSLCGQKLVMPTTITGQNGAQIQQSTTIAPTGCPKIKKRK
jgi:hypothetical protein